MNERELQTRVRDAYNLRIQPAMGRYVMEKMRADEAREEVLAVIGGDARTGRPRVEQLSLAKLAGGLPVHTSEQS